MGKIIAKKVGTREKGKLYYVDKNMNVVAANMNRKGAVKGHKTCKESKKYTPAKKKKK